MGESLNPAPWSRLRHGLRPSWTRTVAARRVAAGLLVLLAAAAALRPDPDTAVRPVLVAARDLAPGITLTQADVQIEKRAATTIPDGAHSDIAAAVDATLAGPARRGEVLTDVRLLGPRLTKATAGPDARIVSLHLADDALVDLIRPGDVVDVLAGGSTAAGPDTSPEVIATDAVVTLVSPPTAGSAGGADRVVLVALPRAAANVVAGTALTRQITVTFH
ncbi:SAF domain-containing protein [Mycolicibacterium cosmeticum]|uniref:SAF domain-containing protein n=1 Tax=Mycolicibacterium cosmeticum TaxID=258533 RepID=UPI003204911B